MTVIAPWQDLLAPTMRPTAGVPALMLDGFLTGVIVAPRPIPRHRWLAALWRDEDLHALGCGAGNGSTGWHRAALDRARHGEAVRRTSKMRNRGRRLSSSTYTSSFDSGSNGAYDQLTRPPSRGS
jgi:hypothetical protein